MNRSRARETTFKFLYSLEITKETNIEEQMELFVENQNLKDNQAIKYLKKIVNGIEENKEEIVEIIKSNIKEEWTLDRIAKIDLALLKLGIYEIKFAEVPFKIVINEVVELAKKYGIEKAKIFINGVLASVVQEKN